MSLDDSFRASLRMPVVCAPMKSVTGPRLVIAACLSGIVGVLPRHNAASAEEFDAWLKHIRTTLDTYRAENPDATIGPLAVNFARAMAADEVREELAICARHGVEVIVNALGDPTELTTIVHDWGGRVFHDVTSLRFAEKAIRAGVDGLTCIVGGGGGHSGLLSPFVFIPRIREMFAGTVLLAGTVTTGAAIRAAEVLGADLAYLGTRFIATEEADVHPAYVRMILEARATDLAYSAGVTGVFANWLSASLVRNGLDPADMPVVQRGSFEHLPPGAHPWRDVWSAGQGVELIADAPPLAEVVSRLEREYAAACAVPAFPTPETLPAGAENAR